MKQITQSQTAVSQTRTSSYLIPKFMLLTTTLYCMSWKWNTRSDTKGRITFTESDAHLWLIFLFYTILIRAWTVLEWVLSRPLMLHLMSACRDHGSLILCHSAHGVCVMQWHPESRPSCQGSCKPRMEEILGLARGVWLRKIKIYTVRFLSGKSGQTYSL